MNKLLMKQTLDLETKILITNKRIFDWYYNNHGHVYVSFSGGKDSTVLLHLVRKQFPNVPAVFCDTGLEYPEIRDFVKTIDNVIWLKPKISFNEVLKKYGYPVVSKEQSQRIYEIRNTKSEYMKKRLTVGNHKISDKWKFLINAPFKISHKCCSVMKKEPAIVYEDNTGRVPYIGVMAVESRLREQSYHKSGCNAYDTKRPQSRPIMFWNENDIWGYIRKNNLKYSSIYDMGYERTGCMFCMYGGFEKFNLMKKTHEKLYNYCMDNLKIKEIQDYIELNGEKSLFD